MVAKWSFGTRRRDRPRNLSEPYRGPHAPRPHAWGAFAAGFGAAFFRRRCIAQPCTLVPHCAAFLSKVVAHDVDVESSNASSFFFFRFLFPAMRAVSFRSPRTSQPTACDHCSSFSVLHFAVNVVVIRPEKLSDSADFNVQKEHFKPGQVVCRLVFSIPCLSCRRI